MQNGLKSPLLNKEEKMSVSMKVRNGQRENMSQSALNPNYGRTGGPEFSYNMRKNQNDQSMISNPDLREFSRSQNRRTRGPEFMSEIQPPQRSMGGVAVAENRDVADAEFIQNTQESEDGKSVNEVPFLVEPSRQHCINIQSLEEEINQIQKLQKEFKNSKTSNTPSSVDSGQKKKVNEVDSQRPDKVYLKNCKIYSQKHMDKLKLKIENYQFKPDDFKENLLSPVFFDRLKQQRGINFNTEKLTIEDLGLIFKTESIKIFVDYIFHEGQLLMIIKTWQKVQLRIPTDEIKKDKEAGRIISIEDLRNENGQLQEDQFTLSNNFFYIKTLQVYNKFGEPIFEPILLEQIFGAFDSFRIYDSSFLNNDGKLYFFKRQFLDRDVKMNQSQLDIQNNQSITSKSMKMSTSSNQGKVTKKRFGEGSVQESQDLSDNRSMMAATLKKVKEKVYLQMFQLDIKTGEQLPIPQVYIEEEDWDAQELERQVGIKKARVKQSFGPMDPTRSQYNIQFSQEFGPRSSHETTVNYTSEQQFLNNQFFGIQKYVTGQEFHPFRIFQVGDYSANMGRLCADQVQKPQVGLPQYLISSTNDKPNVDNYIELNRQIQFLNHIKNFNDEKDTIDFLVQNMFIIVGIKATFKEKVGMTNNIDVKVSVYRRKTVHQYQRIWNIGGIIPQKTKIIQYTDKKEESIDQYFFTDSRNNIQLLMPNFESKLQCQRRIEQIRDAIEFQNKYQDYMMYKKITVQSIEQGTCKCRNVYQKIDHLQSVLDEDTSCAQSFNFFEDLDHQILYLSESKAKHVIIYKMKDERQEKCKSLLFNEDNEKSKSDAFRKKVVLKKASTKMNLKLKTKKEKGISKMREEVCDIDNQTSQAIKGVIPEDLRRNRPNQAYEIQDNDHDEPYASYQLKLTEDNINILQEIDDAGYGIIRLSPEEKRNYCLVDDFRGQKKKVKMFNFFESQQLRLISYVQAKNGDYCLFLFAVYNPDKNFDELTPKDEPLIKRSYIFVRKNFREMESIFASNGDLEIIRNDDDVIILKNWQRFEKMKFTEIKRYQFEDLIDKSSDEEREDDKQSSAAIISRRIDDSNQFKYRELSITLCKFQEDDKTQMNFIPFIYQEKNNSILNKLIVFDICNNKPTAFMSVNPYQSSQDYLYENDNGYNKFMICRSSDMYEQQASSKILTTSQSSVHSKVKFQVFTLYSEKIGRLQCEEFIISHDNHQTKVETFGLKDILFSNKIISKIEWDIIRQSEVFPYLDSQNSCKGCKIRLLLGSDNDGSWINLIDGEDTNLYFYKSDIVLCGNTKMILREEDPSMYVTITSCILRQEVFKKSIFNRSQAYEVLSQAQDLMMRMKIPNLRYLVLHSFEDVKSKDFFRTQEILQGKSLADISLSSAESWLEALSTFRQEWKILQGCVVENVIDGDGVRRDHMQQCNFYPKQCIVQLDLNFMGTIERAFKLNSFKSLKLIFTHILDVIDTFDYQKFVMFELPIIIRQKQIQIDDFYNLSQAERKNVDKGFCNLEIELGHKEMPPFSDLEFDAFRIQNFDNFKQIEYEIADEIWHTDEQKAQMGVKEADKKFETEYFYIDYHHMILGETLRSYRQRKPQKEFNDLLYAKIIAYKVGESQRNSFFLQETIQKIIDSQWMQTRRFQKYIFIIYVLFYCIPMGTSCFQYEDSLMFNIAIWPAFLLLLIEAIQLKEQGLYYFTIGWNIIDSAQLVVFGVLYYMRYMELDRNLLFFPELKLVNIILTFMKLLFYVRIFEDYGFLVQMIILCLKDLVPFFMTYLLFLNFFSMCFIVLNCDIDGEISGTLILNRYQLMLLQVYRTALGELSMPGYEENEIWKNGHQDDIFLKINIVVIWILWVVSTFFMFVIMTNFNIAQITSTYERVKGLEKKISYELKAEMNQNIYLLMSIFLRLTPYRCIIFANTKNSQGKQTELLDDQFNQLKKCILKSNQAFDGKNEEHMRKLTKVQNQQRTLKHFFKDKMGELIKRQEAMKITLLEDLRERFQGQQ